MSWTVTITTFHIGAGVSLLAVVALLWAAKEIRYLVAVCRWNHIDIWRDAWVPRRGITIILVGICLVGMLGIWLMTLDAA